MRLYIMRHGPAEASSASGRDFDRALSPAGRATTERVARELLQLGEKPTAIYASPLRRTQETAAIVSAVLCDGLPALTAEELAPGEDALPLVRSLRSDSPSATLFVAHAPDVSDLVSALLSARFGSFEPAMVVGIDYEGGTARRRFVLRPSEL